MKKRIRTNLVICLVVSFFCLFTVFDAYAFRCGDEIINTGDSKARVISRCGKPMLQEKVGAKKARRIKGEKRTDTDSRYAYKQEMKTTRSVEKWTYNCGDGDFLYVLTFEGGTVASMDTDGRGKGKSECLGR